MRRPTLLLFAAALILILSGSVFSYETQTISNIPFPEQLSGIVYHPSGIFAVSSRTRTLDFIDTGSNTAASKINLDIAPTGMAIDGNGNMIIVSSEDGLIEFIDPNQGKVATTIDLKAYGNANRSARINAIAVNPGTGVIYAGGDGWLMALDLQTGGIIRELSFPGPVISIGLDVNLNYLVTLTAEAGHPESEAMHIYNSETLALISSALVNSASAMSVNPSTHVAVLIDKSSGSLFAVSLQSCIVDPAACAGDTASDVSLEAPSAIDVDPAGNRAFIAHRNGIAIIKLENPVPKINLLIPNSARSGGSGLVLSIEGDKFVQDSRAQFDKKDVPTYFKTNESLQAHLSKEDLTNPGDVPVTVTNPRPGGGISNVLTFSIFNPAPALDSISPDTLYLTPDSQLINPSNPPLEKGGEGGFSALRISGKNFFIGSVVNLNGENLKTKFISSILLEAEIVPSLINSPNQHPVVVINPWPGASTSNVVFLNVVPSSQLPNFLSSVSSSSRPPDFPTSQPSGFGSLTGRILNEHKKPVQGVTVRIKNLKAVTDADGYFRVDNVPAGRRHVIIHGETAKDKGSHHPTIPLTIDVQANTINQMPFQIYLHKQKTHNFKSISPNEDIILTDPEVPGFEMKIPKGVKITGWDGKPNKKVSVRTVAIDRLPVKPLPANADVRTVYMFHFDKVGGGIPDAPIPIKARNDLGLLPGQKAILWYYDESPNEGEAPNDWAVAGTGTVTADGKYIVSDPGVGIPKFCCGASGFGGPGGGTNPGPSTPDCALGGGL